MEELDVRWIIAQYGFDGGCGWLSVQEEGRAKLLEMAGELAGRSGLVAVYIPLGTPDGYEPMGYRGRIAGAARLLKMPRGKRVEDYPSENLLGKVQWPIGWPCKPVFALDEEHSIDLREHVESCDSTWDFGGYTRRFQFGPFLLEAPMRLRLNNDFRQLLSLA